MKGAKVAIETGFYQVFFAMTKKNLPNVANPKQRAKETPEQKKRRLAEQLRQNLRRRKKLPEASE